MNEVWKEGDALWQSRLTAARSKARQLEPSKLEILRRKPVANQQEAFELAVILLDARIPAESPLSRLSRADYLNPARSAFYNLPNVPTYEYSRIRFLVDSQIEERPRVIAQYRSLADRILKRVPTDRSALLFGSPFLARSSNEKDVERALEMANTLLKLYPGNTDAMNVHANALLFLWYSTASESRRKLALHEYSLVRAKFVKEGRNTVLVDECIATLRGGKIPRV